MTEVAHQEAYQADLIGEVAASVDCDLGDAIQRVIPRYFIGMKPIDVRRLIVDTIAKKAVEYDESRSHTP